MVEQFSADLDGLRDRAPEADRTAADVAATVQALRTALAAEGEPWGNDEAGRAFAESYIPDQRKTMADLDALVQLLRQSGQDLRGLANDFENVDALAAHRIANAGNATQRDTEPAVTGGGPARSRSADSVDPTAATDSDGRSSPEAVGAEPVTAATVPGDLINAADGGPAADASRMERPAERDPMNPVTDSNGLGADDPGGPNSPGDGAPGLNEQPPGALAAGPGGPVTNPGAGIAVPPTGAPVPATGTPWSRTTAVTHETAGTSAAARPSTPVNARPSWVSAPGTGATGAPPRPPGRPVAPRKDNRQARRTSRPDAGESLAARLARRLAEQYGVRAFGFDVPGIADVVLLELVAAIDEVLPHNPTLALGAIGIRGLADGALTRVEWDAESGKARIVLAFRAATDPAYLASAVAADEHLRGFDPAGHPVFACVIRELGRIAAAGHGSGE